MTAEHDVEITYRLTGRYPGITAAFKISPVRGEIEDAVADARNLLDAVVGSALDNAAVTKIVITPTVPVPEDGEG